MTRMHIPSVAGLALLNCLINAHRFNFILASGSMTSNENEPMYLNAAGSCLLLRKLMDLPLSVATVILGI